MRGGTTPSSERCGCKTDVDFAALGMGNAESTFLGLRDIMLAAKAMEPPAAVELRVEEDRVRFVVVWTLKVASLRAKNLFREAPSGRATCRTACVMWCWMTTRSLAY